MSQFWDFLFFLVLGIIVFIFARKWGYFRFPHPYFYQFFSFGYLFGAFVIYLGTSLILIPFLYYLVAYFKTGSVQGFKFLQPSFLFYLQFFSMVVLTLLIIIYLLLIPRKESRYILWGELSTLGVKRLIKDFGIGVLSLIISYPMMAVVNFIMWLISYELWKTKGVEQEAVKILSQARNFPIQFSLMAIAVVILIPFVEEVVFRGFFQTWLRQYLGRMGSIFIVAIVFALAHFSPSQGKGNIELITSLFVLACFLGFLYERQRSLWASYGLHMTFNALSVIAIIA